MAGTACTSTLGRRLRMGPMTSEEQHRAFLARQEARRRALAQLSIPAAAPSRPGASRYRLGRWLKAMMAVVLLDASWFVYHVVEFDVPTSVTEALMPRLEQ
jgi:hypothetical protein